MRRPIEVNISYVQSQVQEVPQYSFRIQTILLSWFSSQAGAAHNLPKGQLI